ncbi:toxin-antitoxin system HicB family antitoxin [Limibacter armeniacum]|uniref:toxin-antitoxin system HicB family antitoxin n=1 Tax=Limibacter armeniacum TaxID=466084 RepID=UPI002FE676C9
MKHFKYKGYTGTIEYCTENKQLEGKVLGNHALLTYRGSTGEELEQNFIKTVDSYLDACKKQGIEPDKPYKGSFNVRISPDLHRRAAQLAIDHDQSLNTFVEEAIERHVSIEDFGQAIKLTRGRFGDDLSNCLNKMSQEQRVLLVANEEQPFAVIPLPGGNSLSETIYLLSSRANEERLRESIRQLKRGEGIEMDMEIFMREGKLVPKKHVKSKE